LVEQHEITSTTYDNLIDYFNNNSQKETQSNDGLLSVSTESLDDQNMTKFASLSSIDTSKLHHQASANLSQFSPSISSLAHTLTVDEAAQHNVNHQLYNVIRHPAGTDAKNMEYLQVEESHPAHAFPDFVRILGPNIFLLWKAAILKKRILILTSTPVEKACQFGRLK
jgi:DENN domain-containing protein 11